MSESLSDERLQQEWLVQFRAWADYAELGERFDLTMFNDMEAEMSLRGREPPYELAKTEFDRVTAASRRATDELQRDPEALMDGGRDVEADLSAFRESLKNSKKN